MKKILLSIVTCVTFSAHAEVIITPMLGYTLGGEVKDNNDKQYDIQGSENYALSIEVPVERGQLGLFYSYQDTELDDLGHASSIQYLMFQSRLNAPLSNKAVGYLGVGLGGSYTNADWVDNQYGFAASLYTGLEYNITDNLALTGQIRWLGTIVDSDSQSACFSTPNTSSCYIQFESDWMNQFQSNLGLVFRF